MVEPSCVLRGQMCNGIKGVVSPGQDATQLMLKFEIKKSEGFPPPKKQLQRNTYANVIQGGAKIHPKQIVQLGSFSLVCVLALEP